MSQPNDYDPSTQFYSFELAQPQFPGQELDVEFANIKITTDSILENIELIQRDDGALLNEIVGMDQLSPAVLALLGGDIDAEAIIAEINATLAAAQAAAVAAAVSATASASSATSSASSASTSATTATTQATTATSAANQATASAAAALVSETNAETAETNAETAETNAETAAAAAAVSETNAAASAAKLTGTSTTSNTIGTGSKTWETQANKFFEVGRTVLISSDADPEIDRMAVLVTSYSGTTLTGDVERHFGSGTHTDWTIRVSGMVGEAGAVGDGVLQDIEVDLVVDEGTSLDFPTNSFEVADVDGYKTARVKVLWSCLTPEEYGAAGDGSTDDATAFAAMWTALCSNARGGTIMLSKKHYVLNSVLDLRHTAATLAKFKVDFMGHGAFLDFSGATALTASTDALIRIGTNPTALVEGGHFKIGGFTMLGATPVSQPAASGVSSNKAIGLALIDCYEAHLYDIHQRGIYKGLYTRNTFPLTARNIHSFHCFIGAHLDEDTTISKWDRCVWRKGRFGLVIRPSNDAAGSIYTQTFDTCLFEGNHVGVVLDPRGSTVPAGGIIRSVTFINPYFEAITYDGMRVALTFDEDDSSNAGSAVPGNVRNLTIMGGTWSGPFNVNAINFGGTGGGGGVANVVLLGVPLGLGDITNEGAVTNFNYSSLGNGT